jgi:hypothetical protein
MRDQLNVEKGRTVDIGIHLHLPTSGLIANEILVGRFLRQRSEDNCFHGTAAQDTTTLRSVATRDINKRLPIFMAEYTPSRSKGVSMGTHVPGGKDARPQYEQGAVVNSTLLPHMTALGQPHNISMMKRTLRAMVNEEILEFDILSPERKVFSFEGRATKLSLWDG